MPVWLLAIAVLVPLFQDTLKNLFANKSLQLAALGLGLYYFYNKEKKKSLVENLPDNKAGQLANRLNQAFNPFGFNWLNGWTGNGTDEEAVLQVAKEMSLQKNWVAVADAYKTLYGKDLSDELNAEGVFDEFMAAYNATSLTGGGGIVTKSTAPKVVKQNPKGWSKGDIVYSKGGFNLRSTDKPYEVTNKTVAGEDWILYNNPYQNTINGVSGWWVVVQQPKSRYTFYPSYFVVWLDALYKK